MKKRNHQNCTFDARGFGSGSGTAWRAAARCLAVRVAGALAGIASTIGSVFDRGTDRSDSLVQPGGFARQSRPPTGVLAGNRWCAATRCLGWLLLVGWGGLNADLPVSKEYQIKATFVFNFTKFLEWPVTSSPVNGAPIVIGVFPGSRYTREIENAARDRKVKGRPISVVEVNSIEEARGVHMLVFDAVEEARMKSLLQALKDTPVLTIGESEAFAASGGMLNLVRDGDKLSFEINLDAVQPAGLKLSAQFLKLAKIVKKPS